MIFKFKTADGVVVVKVNVPNPEVLVDGNRVTVTWADGGKQAEIHLPPGSRKIELKKDGFKAFGETVSIEDGGQELLAATLEPLSKPAIDRASAGRGPGYSSTALSPPLAIAPFDAAQAKAHQAAWAKHLGTKIETTNSVGAKMIVIPPGEFLMGSTDEQVAAALKVAEEIKADQDAKDSHPKDRTATAPGCHHQAVSDGCDGSDGRPVPQVRRGFKICDGGGAVWFWRLCGKGGHGRNPR